MSTIVREPVALTVAGRTDAGVHARAQTVHVDVPTTLWNSALRGRGGPDYEQALQEGGQALSAQASQRLAHRVNGLLARRYAQFCQEHGLRIPRGTSDIVIHSIHPVSCDFDARFSAIGRSYIYRMSDGQAARSPLRRHDVVWLGGNSLNIDAMNAAAAPLRGERDFLSYCRPREGATTIRTLRTLEFQRDEEGVIHANVEADAFCHSMVRSLVGAAIEVGSGRREVGWMMELLAARSRAQAAPIAPAHGLTLHRVEYPPAEEWAVRAQAARRRRDTEDSDGYANCCGDE